MAEVKGLIIEIGADTSKMNKALQQLQAPLKKLQGELKYLDKALKLDPKNATLLKQKMVLLEKAVKEAESNATQLRSELERLKAAKAPDEQIRRLERELAMADAEAKKLNKDMLAFKASQSKIGQLSTSLKTLGSRLTSVGNSMRSVSIYAGMATAAIGAMGYKAAVHADDLNTLSKKCGVATESLQKFSATSQLVDVSTEDMAKAQSKVVKAMAAGSDVFEKYGIATKNADGTMRDSEDVFLDYMDAMGDITNETERAAAMQELFGAKAYQSLMPLAGNVDILKEYGDRFEELGLIMDQDTLDRLNEIKDKMDYLKAVGSLAFYKIGSAIIQAIGPALEGLDEKMAAFADWVAGLNPIAVKVGLAIGGILTAAAPLLIIFGHIASGVGALLGVFSKLTPAIKLAIGPIGRFTPLLVGALGPVGTAIAVIGALVGAFNLLSKSGVDVEEVIGNFVQGLTERINTIAQAAPQIITGLVNAISENLPQMIDAAVQVLNALIAGIVNNLPLLISAGLKLLLALAQAIVKNMPAIIAAGRRILIALVRGILAMMPTLRGAMISLALKIPGWIKQAIKGLAAIGGQIIAGLWNGIKDKAKWLKDKIKGFVGNVKTWLKKFFKIGSPSRLMADEIGKWIPEGIAVGIEGNMRGLERTVNGMADATVPDISTGSSAQNGGIDYTKLAAVMVEAFDSVTITANSYLDGKKVSNAIAGEMDSAINTLQTRQARMLGIVGV